MRSLAFEVGKDARLGQLESEVRGLVTEACECWSHGPLLPLGRCGGSMVGVQGKP